MPALSIPRSPQKRDSLKVQSEDDPLGASVSSSGKWGQSAPSNLTHKAIKMTQESERRGQLLAMAPCRLIRHFLLLTSHQPATPAKG